MNSTYNCTVITGLVTLNKIRIETNVKVDPKVYFPGDWGKMALLSEKEMQTLLWLHLFTSEPEGRCSDFLKRNRKAS